jgi:hypothetical protein
MANEYASLTDLKAALSLTGETFADADLELALEAASRCVDDITGRRFYADEDADQVRIYTASSGGLLLIDDLIKLTTLKSDEDGDGTFETTWSIPAYSLYPANAAANGRPYNLIAARSKCDQGFPTAGSSIEVTGKFGWDAVPAQVKQATMLIASKLVRRTREAPFGIVSGYEGDAARIGREDPDVCMLLNSFRLPFAI